MNNHIIKTITFTIFSLFTTAALAGEVNITPEIASILVPHEGKLVKIERNQDTEAVITGGFAKTSRKCPPFCVQPMQVMDGVTPVGEMELIEFMDSKLSTGAGVVIDTRTPSWHKRGTIPGSINIPFTTFDKDHTDLEIEEAMELLGVIPNDGSGGGLSGIFSDKKVNDKWDFTNAKDLVLWCNGPWCGQSPRAIKALVTKHGYPAEKIFYYRGGMQMWQIFGLTVVTPE